MPTSLDFSARLAQFEQDNARREQVLLLTLHLLGAGMELPPVEATPELITGVIERIQSRAWMMPLDEEA